MSLPLLPLLLPLLLLLLSPSHTQPPPPPPYNLSIPRTALASSSLPPSLIIFAGGRTSDGKVSNVVDMFNTRTRARSTAFLSQARADMAAAGD